MKALLAATCVAILIFLGQHLLPEDQGKSFEDARAEMVAKEAALSAPIAVATR